MLEGSWILTRAMNPLETVITIVSLLITLLLVTHEPPSRALGVQGLLWVWVQGTLCNLCMLAVVFDCPWVIVVVQLLKGSFFHVGFGGSGADSLGFRGLVPVTRGFRAS